MATQPSTSSLGNLRTDNALSAVSVHPCWQRQPLASYQQAAAESEPSMGTKLDIAAMHRRRRLRRKRSAAA